MSDPYPEADMLLNAAEASITAAVEVARATNGVYPWPPDLMGSPLQPPCLDPFTKFEIEEGCAFLVRLGFLEPPKSPPQRVRAARLKGGVE